MESCVSSCCWRVRFAFLIGCELGPSAISRLAKPTSHCLAWFMPLSPEKCDEHTPSKCSSARRDALLCARTHSSTHTECSRPRDVVAVVRYLSVAVIRSRQAFSANLSRAVSLPSIRISERRLTPLLVITKYDHGPIDGNSRSPQTRRWRSPDRKKGMPAKDWTQGTPSDGGPLPKPDTLFSGKIDVQLRARNPTFPRALSLPPGRPTSCMADPGRPR